MDKPDKHSNTSLEKFLNYFKGLLSNKEQHSLEKEMMQDSFAEEAWEGLSQFDARELESDLDEINARIRQRTKKRRFVMVPVLRYAAAAVLVLALGTTIYLIRQSVQKAPTMYDLSEISDSLKPAEVTAPVPKDTAKPEIAEARPKASNKVVTKGEVSKEPEPQELSRKREEIDEVVVTGYGSQKKEAVTGAIASTRNAKAAKPIETIPAEDALQGRVAGITIAETMEKDMDTSMEIASEKVGTPGNTPEIKIRGISTTSQKGNYEDFAQSPESTIHTFTSPVKEIKGERVIEGLVYSDDGDPLPGVNVLIKGTNIGAITNLDGEFTLEIPTNYEGTLVFSYIGFEQEEIPLDDQNNISLAMSEDMMALDEVVVIGYGVHRKSDLTGSVSSISGSELNMDKIDPHPVDIEFPPRPDEGNVLFRDYIQENINYNNLPYFTDKVIVKLSFTVSADGRLGPIKVEKSGGDAFDKEAIRLIKEGPAWHAGSLNGNPVSDEVILRIKFKPPEY